MTEPRIPFTCTGCLVSLLCAVLFYGGLWLLARLIW
jgi:high-affinity Fe2+/Pb2+ permease